MPRTRSRACASAPRRDSSTTRSPTTTSCARCSRRSSERASVRIGAGTLRFTPTTALGALLPKRLAQARVRHAADGSNLTFVVGEQLFLKAYRRLRARRASRMGARPLPHGALALRRRRADGRRDRARAAVGRADDRRSRASRRTEPGRRLALHAALPRAQHRRRRGTRDRRRDRPWPTTRATCCSCARSRRARPSCTARSP